MFPIKLGTVINLEVQCFVEMTNDLHNTLMKLFILIGILLVVLETNITHIAMYILASAKHVSDYLCFSCNL